MLSWAMSLPSGRELRGLKGTGQESQHETTPSPTEETALPQAGKSRLKGEKF